ncbi:hypothetical protein [Tardiphaga sp.]|uniref:hypothetical protein n=1 Tax=Tardiphaga sp. TaxID=1926292 RepID=UPI0025D0770C|nr:hypothetical protein [Tardiphaga sp.]
MFNRKTSFSTIARASVLAAVAALTLTSFAPTAVLAAPAARGVSADHGSGTVTEFSSARRRHHRGNGNAAGLAAFGAIVGTIGAIAASQNRRDYYDQGPRYGYYGGGPAYYGGGPAYYGGPYGGYGGGHGYDNSRRMTW